MPQQAGDDVGGDTGRGQYRFYRPVIGALTSFGAHHPAIEQIDHGNNLYRCV
jgi:hypothetical protein